MHQTLSIIQQSLTKIIAQVQATIPNDEPFGIAHNNWSFPSLTRSELIEEAQSIIDIIDAEGVDELGSHEARLQDYVRRLQFLLQHTVPQLWGNASQAVPAYQSTLLGLRRALGPVLNQDGHAQAVRKLKVLAGQLRSLEARLKGLQPRTVLLSTMIERIEKAHGAADQLPTDLETLAEAQQKIDELVRAATQDQGRILDAREQADDVSKLLAKSVEDANAVLQRCETAYSAATSVGLAAAFSERSRELSRSMWFWIASLMAALGLGSYFGSKQLGTLSQLFKTPDVPPSVVALNLLLSILSVGAPVWFAWLATKQIGQRFRLAEDYAYKASISRAYEGFRREAARFDKEMETKLLTSALTRLDELPLRLVEAATHGSPWHELASSNAVKKAIRIVPDFAEQVGALANKSIDAIKPSKSKPKVPSVQASE
ncbi:hypothetical protein J2Y48_000432 [Mycoplana sp. BE70]|uniref:hypothetical protein n=1 Tax=Mycoplana sp. BE70 TaxID=2817775 RepID=UPI00285CAB2C|nr:hypothetical protein [Mycoplana sp. BE70]MDR6755159.1 hypothetical protein [Mycoplana sp. BE70]